MAIGKADKNLTLGIWFTGNMSKSLKNMDRKISASLTKAQQALNKYASGLNKVDAANKKLSQSQKDMTKQLGRITGAWSRVKSAAKVTAAYGVAATAIYAVTSALRGGVSEIMNYDQALKNLQAITMASDMEIGGMAETMRQLARDTKFSTGEVAEGMVLLGQAGLTAAEVMSSIKGATTLATGTLSNMKMTTDLLTSTLRAFMLDASDTGRIVDVMASAINRSKLTIDKLRISFNYVGAAAAQTGLSLEETAATMMVLANNGLRASTIGTGMRQVLSRLLAPSRKLKDAFEKHGIALDKVNPRLVGYQESIKNLAPLLWDTKKNVVDMAKAYELFGLRGAQAAAVIIKSYVSGDWDDMLEKVYDVGAATRMAAIQQEGLAVKWKNFKDRVLNIALAFGDAGLSGALNSFISKMQTIATVIEIFIRDWGRATAETIAFTVAVSYATRAVIALAAVSFTPWIAGLISGFGALYVQLGIVRTALHLLKRQLIAVNTLMGPIGWAALAASAIWSTYYYIMHKLNKETKVSLPLLRRQGMETQQLVDKIRDVSGQLAILREKYKGNVEASREYRAILKRLIVEYPALDSIINILGDSYEETTKKLRLFQIQQEKGQWKDWATQIKEYTKTLGAVNSEFQARFLKSATEDIDFFKSLPEDTRRAVQYIDVFTSSIAESMAEMIKSGDQTEFSIKNTLWSLFGFIGAADFAYEKVLAILNKVKDGRVDLFKGDAETEKSRKARIQSDRQYFTMMARWSTDATIKAKKEHEVRLLDIKKWTDARYEIVKKSHSGMMALRIKYNSLRRREESKYQYELIKIEVDAEIKKAERLFGAVKAGIIKTAKEKELTQKQFLQVDQDIAAAQTTLQNAKIAAWDKGIVILKAKFGEENEVVKEAIYLRDQIEADAELKILRVQAKGQKSRLLQRNIYLRRMLEDTREGTVEWLFILEEAYKADLMSHQEYMDKKTAATGGMLTNFNYGMAEAKRELQSWGALWQEVGQDINDQLASGLVDGMFAVAEGTKSAEEAFQDYAQSVLKWLSEIIIKQMILNALNYSSPGSNPWQGANQGTVGGVMSMEAHRGGIVGKTPFPVRVTNSGAFLDAPRLHRGGLANNEVPTILKKGEGVFTEEQMKAMGGGDVSIVNITDPRLLDQYLATPRGKNAIFNVIGSNPTALRRLLR